jgi:hypothetical protein
VPFSIFPLVMVHTVPFLIAIIWLAPLVKYVSSL